jgi:hypothetical protein
MKFSGTWAADYIRNSIIPDFRAFEDVVTKRVLPTFDTFAKEALEHGEKWFRARAGHLDLRTDEEHEAAEYLADRAYKAAEYFADKAMDETFAFADMLASMYFASIGLYSVGLFHLFEQHAADLRLRLLNAGSYRKEIKLREVTDWLKAEAVVEVETFGSWSTVRELRLVANTIKHAEGNSAAQLRRIRPELFIHPSKREGSAAVKPVGLRIRKPLFGEDLYLTPGDFSRYTEGIVAFWTELAHALSRHPQ